MRTVDNYIVRECIMIVRMTLCSLDWVSVLCVATCVNKVTYAGCVYKLKCLPIVYVTIFTVTDMECDLL